MAIELPKTKVKAITQDPKYLILFGLPKVGKTTVLSTLENNLIIDLESGSDYVDALKIKANNVKDLKDIAKAIKDNGCPYKYITLDTITALEEMVKPLAIQLYHKSPQFSDRYADVTDPTLLPNGSGYGFVRTAIEMIIDMFAKITPNIILCGHVKDVSLNEGLDGSVKDLDLVGKTKRILSAKSDAIGFVHRDDDGNLCINFGQDGEVLTGARPTHLANKDIIVAERNEDGTFTSHWGRVYPSEA
jgi:hypothetical protein